MTDDGEDQVGYGKPPKKHRFRKGQSGNPAGRPKKASGDEDLRTMVAGLLAGEPLVLHGAGSLAEARAALSARHHELVILDLMLPDGDGAELIGELALARPPTRVIIFSARESALPESTVILRRLV